MCESTGGHAHHHHGHAHPAGSAALGRRARPDDLRVVITGKGGVGKTSLTALLARLLTRRDWRVLALDADPQMNLPWALGLAAERARALTPLSENAAYVEEKTGARAGDGWGLFFRLNPAVDDVVERFGVMTPDDVRLLVMGNTVQPAAGCLCPENALLAAVVNALGLRRDEAVLMDTQAGFEHFGRALAKGFRHALVVTDASFNGLQVALHAARLARALEIEAIHLVVNGVRDDADYERTLTRLEDEGGFPFASRHRLPWDDRLRRCEPRVEPLLAAGPSPLVEALEALVDALVAGAANARVPMVREVALPCVF